MSESLLLEIEERKKRLRQIYRVARDSYPHREDASRAICSFLQNNDSFRRAVSIFLYSPIGSEPDLTALAQIARAAGKVTAYPKIADARGVMEFFPVTEESDMPIGKYGIREPHPTSAEAPLIPLPDDLILVPALAADREGNRLGYGGGYYDRFLATYPNTTAVCVVFDVSLADSLPHTETDIPLSLLVGKKGGCDFFEQRAKRSR